jgi:hypothetical protein
MEEALQETADRIGSKNFSFVITAVNIQRQVGGSLAGLFDMVADTVRDRQQFARKIRSLTAMGRASAYVLLALPFYERSADQGIADAQYAVAQIYRKVADVPAEKRQLAREYLVRAARAGFDTAQLDIGIWLINGIAGPQDLEQGFKWLRIAANRGNVAAQNRLSHAYVGALGTRPDPVEAAKWYVLSRRAGLTDPALEDFYLGLPDSQQKQAIDAANKYRTGQRKLGRSPPRVGNGGKPAPVGGAAEQTGAGGEQKIVAKPDEPPADPTALPGVTVPPPGAQPQAPQGDDEDPG